MSERERERERDGERVRERRNSGRCKERVVRGKKQ